VDPDFFARLGLYIGRGFLSADECERLITEARAGTNRPATVREGNANVVDDDYRRSRIADVSADSVALVSDRIAALRPALEDHFEVKATGYRPPEFLIYRPGDFFKAHADSVPVGTEAGDKVVTGRVISTIVFLNGESAEPEAGSFTGGTLGFFGLMDDPRMANREFGLTGEAGLLVAFKPEIVHRIAPVTDGERFTIVTWFKG
jgi:predicted 2-oxoglutarate/Fe(II)-dependent dioxygenase YbiX